MANKTLQHIEVRLTALTNFVGEFSDTVRNPIATYMLESFKQKNYMHGVATNNKEYFIPFHAVDSITVHKSQATAPDRPDAYGCGDETVFETIFEGDVKLSYVQMAGIYSGNATTSAWSPKVGDKVAITFSDGKREVSSIESSDGTSAHAEFSILGVNYQLSGETYETSTSVLIVASNDPIVSVTKLEVEAK